MRWVGGPLLLVKRNRVDFVMRKIKGSRVDFVMRKIKGSPLPAWHAFTKNVFDP